MADLPQAVLDALAKLEPKIRAAFAQAIAEMKAQANLAEFVRAINAGDLNAAYEALHLDKPSAFSALQGAIREAYLVGGQDAVTAIIKTTQKLPGGPFLLGFDGTAKGAMDWARQWSSEKITGPQGIIQGQRETARLVIEEGLSKGRAPRSVALDIVGKIGADGKRTGGFLGLTPSQTQWVQNYRAKLQSGDPALLRAIIGIDEQGNPIDGALKLRDKRFDAAVKRAIKDGKPIPAEKIDSMVTAYQNRALKYRGDMIGRTEALNSLRAGQYEGYRQLVETGKISENQIERTWLATADSRTRHDHVLMSGAKVNGLTAAFVLPDGSRMMYPGDGSLGASAAEIIQCRCTTLTRVHYLPR